MILSKMRSDRRDRRICRFGVMLVVCSLLVNMVCVPKAKAVAVVDDVAIGAAATAAYFTSTGIPLTVTAGGASAASAGIVAVAGEYAAATGAAASGEALLGSIAAGTALTAAGAVVLTAAAAAVVGALAYWVYETYLSDDSVASIYNDFRIISNYNVCWDGSINSSNYLDYLIPFGSTVVFDTGYSITSYVDDSLGSRNIMVDVFKPDGTIFYSLNPSLGYQSSNDVHGWCIIANSSDSSWHFKQIWDNTGGSPSGIVTGSNTSGHSSHTIIGYPVESELSISDIAYPLIPDIDSANQLELDIAAPSDLELADLSEYIMSKVASGDLAQPSVVPYSVTSVDPDPEPEPDPSPDPDPEPDPDPSPDPDAPELPSNLGDLGAALTTRFPFSIPWDIARAIKLIAAPAQAPYWEVDFLAPMAHWVGGFSGSTKVVLDFGKPEYEIIGIASRWTSTIGFCLALAAATKRFIWTA